MHVSLILAKVSVIWFLSSTAESIIRDEGGTTYNLSSGENVSLSCTVDGSPVADIVWLRNGQFLQTRLNNRFQILEESVPSIRVDVLYAKRSILTIVDLTGGDSGLYSCKASNGFSSAALLQQPYQLSITSSK